MTTRWAAGAEATPQMKTDDSMHNFIPVTSDQEQAMLRTLGLSQLTDLFANIPEAIRSRAKFQKVPPKALSEYEVLKRLQALAVRNTSAEVMTSYLGAGIYDHFVPSAVRHLLMRSEFYTAYTPYQPEVAQGTLQAIFEFQSLICGITGMALANASHYDGASALAESALIACAASDKPEILISAGVNPRHRAVVSTYLKAAGYKLSVVELGEDGRTRIPPPAMMKEAAGLILAYPNYYGVIEDLSSFSKVKGDALLITTANPIALALLKAPGDLGADICVGDGINLGNGVSFGGPGLGYMAVSTKLMRRIPGRIVGKTNDVDGKEAYVLTLQAREQHIRRQRASSNICTNQSLMALAATIYMSLLGKQGLKQVATTCYHNAHYLANQLSEKLGLTRHHTGPFFHEFSLKLSRPAAGVLTAMEGHGVLAGVDLAAESPAMGHGLLIATTEKRTREELDRYVRLLGESNAI